MGPGGERGRGEGRACPRVVWAGRGQRGGACPDKKVINHTHGHRALVLHKLNRTEKVAIPCHVAGKRGGRGAAFVF